MDLVLSLVVFLMTEAARFPRLLGGHDAYEEWKPGMKRKILLVGYNGARNTGSDVRVAAIARQIRELFGFLYFSEKMCHSLCAIGCICSNV